MMQDRQPFEINAGFLTLFSELNELTYLDNFCGKVVEPLFSIKFKRTLKKQNHFFYFLQYLWDQQLKFRAQKCLARIT